MATLAAKGTRRALAGTAGQSGVRVRMEVVSTFPGCTSGSLGGQLGGVCRVVARYHGMIDVLDYQNNGQRLRRVF